MDSKVLKKLGIKIGHYTDAKNLTGTTVFIAEKGAEIGIDIRGSDTGSFNTHMYGPKGASDAVPGITCAVIHDIGVDNRGKRPGKIEGYTAAKNASYSNLAQGNIGVGT